MLAIRPSTSADAPRLFEIWRGAVRATHAFLSPEDFSAIEAMVRDDYLPHTRFHVAQEGGRVLGFIGLSGAHIDALFVDPASHGRGVGRALVEGPGAHADTVDVNEQNEGGVAFWTQMGFAPERRSRVDGEGRPYPLLHLRRA